MAIEQERTALYQLLNAFSNIFAWEETKLGRTKVMTHKIDTGSARPIWLPPRRIPPHLYDEVQKIIAEMFRDGVIIPSKSPWASPVTLVLKKDGSIRFCVEYRRLNALTKRDSFPLPRIDDTLDFLTGCSWFSTLDLKSGYWQVEVDPKDREKTAFILPNGLDQFETMPFGLCNAAATFQRLMQTALQGLYPKQCLIYLDDVILFGRTAEEHNDNLRTILGRLQEAGITLNPKKCCFLRRSVAYLGYTIYAREDPSSGTVAPT